VALGLTSSLAAPPATAARSEIPSSSETLVFGTTTARTVGGAVVIPVECLGARRGFCAGVVTLSWGGHRSSEPFSVRGGGKDTLFVPLRIDRTHSGGVKVRGVAATAQSVGPPQQIKALIFVR